MICAFVFLNEKNLIHHSEQPTKPKVQLALITTHTMVCIRFLWFSFFDESFQESLTTLTLVLCVSLCSQMLQYYAI